MEQLLAQTNLPSVHPALVHFPIVLWLVGVVLEVSGLLRRDDDSSLGRYAVGFYVAGFVSAFATWMSGRQAADLVGLVDAETEMLISAHSDSAMQTLWILGVSATGRAVVEMLKAQIEPTTRLVLRLLVLLPAVIGAGMIGLTADRGGGLVYGRGVGVTPRSIQSSAAAEEGMSPAGQGSAEEDQGVDPELWQTEGDGSYVFQAAQTRVRRLDSLFERVHEKPFQTVLRSDEGTGIDVSGEGFLLVPKSFGDVMMIADLDLSDFRGELSLVYHYSGPDRFEAYSMGPQAVRLEEITASGVNRFDEAKHLWPTTSTRLAVSVAGKHLKGYADGQTLVHGHRPAIEEDGRVGLFLRGEGHVEIREIRVRPIQ